MRILKIRIYFLNHCNLSVLPLCLCGDRAQATISAEKTIRIGSPFNQGIFSLMRLRSLRNWLKRGVEGESQVKIEARHQGGRLKSIS